MIGSILILWIFCGICAYCITVINLERDSAHEFEFDYLTDKGLATFFAIFGPIGLFTALLIYCIGKYVYSNHNDEWYNL